MRVAVFSTKSYDREFLNRANASVGHELSFYEAKLSEQTAKLAEGFPAVCAFVNDVIDAGVVAQLARQGVRLIALRCAGFNNVDLKATEAAGICVARVPSYSPHSVAEHTVAMILALNRRLYKAYNRVREGNFALDGLIGFDLNGRTVGVVGTGKIGLTVGRILTAFGCRALAYDVAHNPAAEAIGMQYVPLEQLFAESDIITLHCPLLPATYHLIDGKAIEQMKRGVMLVNTSRGALVDTVEVIRGLKSGVIASMGMDVYEEEEELFFQDLSGRVLQDDVFARMLTFPNVLVTAHQAFFTSDALEAIARETMANVSAFEQGKPPPGLTTSQRVVAGEGKAKS